MANPRSTAKIAGHPIHPMLIPFPIAFFVATFVCDLVYWQTGYGMWATATLWLLGAGLVMAALAAVAGLTDVIGDQRIRALNDAWWHAGGNVIVVLIELYTWYARYQEGGAAVGAVEGADPPAGIGVAPVSAAERGDVSSSRFGGDGDGLDRSRRRWIRACR